MEVDDLGELSISNPKPRIRSYQARDYVGLVGSRCEAWGRRGRRWPVCQRLTPGRLRRLYGNRPPNHLWLAEWEGQVVGTAGLVHAGPLVARLASVSMDVGWKRSAVLGPLLGRVVAYGLRFGYARLRWEEAGEGEWLASWSRALGVRPVGCFPRGGGEICEFYIGTSGVSEAEEAAPALVGESLVSGAEPGMLAGRGVGLAEEEGSGI